MLKDEAKKILEQIGLKNIEKTLEFPRTEVCDLASTICFKIAKEEGRDPKEIAEEIVKKIRLKDSLIEAVEAKNGYINFFFNWEKVAEKILKDILTKKEKYGSIDIGKNKVAVVEFSSPNPVHPIHIGSARSTFIGESLCRILEKCGYKVKRIFFVNDIGRQVAILIWGYLKFAKGRKPTGKADHWLLDIYIKANKFLAENPEKEMEISEILKKLELGDKKIQQITKKIVKWCLNGFKQTYRILGIKFDEYIWESDFLEDAKKYVKQLIMEKKAFETSDGAVVVDLEKYNLPNTVILRYDGTTLYLIRDTAASIYRFKKYSPELNVYVVAEDQRLHFQQQFEILKLLGYEKIAQNSTHLSYGYVLLPEGKIISRFGRVVLLDDVIQKAIEEVRKRYLISKNLAKIIGIGAVIYSILKIDPNKQVTFKWSDVLSLEGDTGPYLQYAYVRCASILKKVKKIRKNFFVEKLDEKEKILIKKISQFPQVIEQAAKDLRPNYICNYAYDLAVAFNNFYENCPVLNIEDRKRKNFRLTLVLATEIVLKSILKLIGIEVPQKM